MWKQTGCTGKPNSRPIHACYPRVPPRGMAEDRPGTGQVTSKGHTAALQQELDYILQLKNSFCFFFQSFFNTYEKQHFFSDIPDTSSIQTLSLEIFLKTFKVFFLTLHFFLFLQHILLWKEVRNDREPGNWLFFPIFPVSTKFNHFPPTLYVPSLNYYRELSKCLPISKTNPPQLEVQAMLWKHHTEFIFLPSMLFALENSLWGSTGMHPTSTQAATNFSPCNTPYNKLFLALQRKTPICTHTAPVLQIPRGKFCVRNEKVSGFRHMKGKGHNNCTRRCPFTSRC